MAAIVDCRSLIEFCRAFEHHRNRPNPPPPSSSARKSKSLNPLSHPFCSHAPFAAIDTLLLILVLIALSVLAVPSFGLLLHHFSDLLHPLAADLLPDLLYYLAGLFLVIITGFAVWELINHHFRKCGNPYCKGLRKAVEFDIQLESEEYVRYLLPAPMDAFGVAPLELGRDHKELEVELRKMAPLNGRTVLIFRSRCGCPAGRMEVWGAKKVRRIKKVCCSGGQTFSCGDMSLGCTNTDTDTGTNTTPPEECLVVKVIKYG